MSEVGRLGPASHPLVISVDDSDVVIGHLTGGWALDAERRDRFQRLFMQAEREAEAWQAGQQKARLDGDVAAEARHEAIDRAEAFRDETHGWTGDA